MALQVQNEDIRAAAQKLAEANIEAASEIQEIYLFPDEEEIRLVEIDPTTLPGKEITPFYFAPDPADGIPFRSAIALIRPEEKERLSLPSGWGSWKSAVKIWPKG
jgi:hypothetical protein